ncbi:uncharacterized protein LOC130628955 [Hydractinia symbiolongicarpus]|uniref:uncharacterized protein LOC130628955 n=1 Tax=Hydractinia symbiolongicarpus TaxID=13093 RepID=UPI00254C7420|nr:uncharacterized protein LOC130628955 [Hydractinia symbiolongicarpus]XP_057298004.1 uncharacterized protein LOC130628955 [Hydractinia symbiolongicarpus]XP_057298005.1 uncharacterized protein LOC130628955 [Hydractinia symbiolongicarpus]
MTNICQVVHAPIGNHLRILVNIFLLFLRNFRVGDGSLCPACTACFVERLLVTQKPKYAQLLIVVRINSVKVIPVQQQKNGVDCGAFAVAFAYHTVATKKLPIDINFETSKMRNHMLQCLTANQITKFPQCDSHIIARRCASKEISIDLYCSCRMPWRAAESYILDKQMAECSNCGGWFHRMCERIADSVFEVENCKSLWYCYCCFTNISKT